MKIRELGEREVYVIRGYMEIHPSTIERVLIKVERLEQQPVDVPDIEYEIKFYYPAMTDENLTVSDILFAKARGFGHDLSQNLGIFVSKEELLEHIQNELDKLL